MSLLLHEANMPTVLRDVRYWMNSGKHLLAASISEFDPSATSTVPRGITPDAGFSPMNVPV
jgi:hypothetical protein